MPTRPPTLPTDPTITEDRTRTLAIDYPADEGQLTLDQLRDFVHRTRNQHGVPNWPGDTPVSVVTITGGTVRLVLIATERLAAPPTPGPAIPQEPLPLGVAR